MLESVWKIILQLPTTFSNIEILIMAVIWSPPATKFFRILSKSLILSPNPSIFRPMISFILNTIQRRENWDFRRILVWKKMSLILHHLHLETAIIRAFAYIKLVMWSQYSLALRFHDPSIIEYNLINKEEYINSA